MSNTSPPRSSFKLKQPWFSLWATDVRYHLAENGLQNGVGILQGVLSAHTAPCCGQPNGGPSIFVLAHHLVSHPLDRDSQPRC